VQMSALYDRKGCPIERGDIVKVFHFIGARGKRYYIYKQALGLTTFGSGVVQYMRFSHLLLDGQDRPYTECADGRVLRDYEVVQSERADHENRPRRPRRSELAALPDNDRLPMPDYCGRE
jgi:hypothetical protein